MRQEDELRARFSAMRNEEMSAAPPFSAPARRRRTLPAAGLVAAVAAVSIVVAAAWLVLDGPPHEDPLAFLQLDRTEWVGPTDFLLDTGNRSLLSTIPEIGQMGRPTEAERTENPESRDTMNIERRRS